jgi:uncharacterized membrane protein
MIMLKEKMVYVMGLLYIAAGVNHFMNPAFYEGMIPFLPQASLLNILSGVVEILLGIGVMFVPTRRIAAFGLIALLIVVFPANIYMALHWQNWGDSPTPFLIRLPFQLVFIWWAWLYTKKAHG